MRLNIVARQRGGARDHRGPDRDLQAARRRDRRALRRAPLPELPLPAHAQRPRRALRPRAPRVERRPHRRALADRRRRRRGRTPTSCPHEFVHSWNGKYRRPGGARHARLPAAHEGRAALGLRGADRVPRRGADRRAAASGRPSTGATTSPSTAAYLDTVSRPHLAAARATRRSPRSSSTTRRAPGRRTAAASTSTTRASSSGSKPTSSSASRRRASARSTISAASSTAPPGGAPEVKPYTFDDVVAALNEVAPYDWKAFFDAAPRFDRAARAARRHRRRRLEARVHRRDERPPARGRGRRRRGEPELLARHQGRRTTGRSATSSRTRPPRRPASGPGMKLVAVNGRRHNVARLREAIKAAKGTAREDRAARRERRLLQDARPRLPRRRALPAPPARRVEAGPALRDREAADQEEVKAPSARTLQCSVLQ